MFAYVQKPSNLVLCGRGGWLFTLSGQFPKPAVLWKGLLYYWVSLMTVAIILSFRFCLHNPKTLVYLFLRFIFTNLKLCYWSFSLFLLIVLKLLYLSPQAPSLSPITKMISTDIGNVIFWKLFKVSSLEGTGVIFKLNHTP